MHFRLRNKAVQVIRTKYDPKTKKAKNQILGKILKAKPEISEELKKACTPEELKEVQAWVGSYTNTERLKQEFAAKTLPEQMALAAEWFSERKDEQARLAASSILSQWLALRGGMKKQGLIE